jgi:tetratricopeptide (TPR) repeat protein
MCIRRIILLLALLLLPLRVAFADNAATAPSQDLIDKANAEFAAAHDDFTGGSPDKALTEYENAEALFVQAYGSRQVDEVGLCLNSEALCLEQLNRDADAAKRYKEALDISEKLAGNADDVGVATVMSNYANCLHRLNRNDDAYPLAKSAMEMRQRLAKGQDDADLAWSMNSVAQCLEGLDRSVEALPLYQSALKMRQRLHNNQDDPEVAESLTNLANCYDILRKDADALPFYRSAYEMKSRLAKGQDDPDVAVAENGVGYCQYALGHYLGALPYLQGALDMRRRLFKDQDNDDVLASLNNLGQCLSAMGRSAKALEKFQEALAMARRMYKNQDSPQLATVIDNVAGCQQAIGHAAAALPMFEEALAMRQRLAAGNDDDSVATSLNNVATCLGFLGNRDNALAKLYKALAMLQRLSRGKDSVEVAQAMSNVGECLDELGRSAEALPYFTQAMELQERIFNGADHPDIADSLTKISNCYTSLGRREEALAAENLALQMLRRLYERDDLPEIADAMSNYGVCLDNLDRFDESVPYFVNALHMRQRLFKDQDNAFIALNLALLAGAYMSLDNAEEALPYYRRALAMQQRVFAGQDHPVIAWTMTKLAVCLSSLNRKADALPYLRQAVESGRRTGTPDLYRFCTSLGDCLFSLNRLDEAANAYQQSIEAFEHARAALGGDDQDRMKFMDAEDGCDAFLAMVRVELKLHHPDKAAEFLDRGRARSLLDMLERSEHEAGGDLLSSIEQKARAAGDNALLRNVAAIRVQLDSADQRVRQLTAQINYARSIDSDDARAQVKALQPELSAAMEQYDQIHRSAFNLAGATTFSQAASASQIQEFLKPHQHLLMYSVTDHDALLLVVPPPGQPISAVTLAGSDDLSQKPGVELERAIVLYIQSLIRHREEATRGARFVNKTPQIAARDMPKEGYALFQKLMPDSVWRQIKDDDLVYVIPDSGMNGLPLETLVVKPPADASMKNCTYWIDQGPPICYAPSAAALLKLCAENSAQTRTYKHQAVLLGDPILQRDAPAATEPSAVPSSATAEQLAAAQTRDASLAGFGPLQPLPGTRTEIMGICQALGKPYGPKEDDPVVVLLGEDATYDRLARAVAGTRYLHLATHGLARSGRDAMYSAIVLTQPRDLSSGDTGLLTLHDLFRWSGKLAGTQLVVLSACDSQGIDQAMTNAVTDEGVFGLPWGFWCAGCPAVVASLWEVQDNSTAELMQDFYRDLAQPSATSKLAAFTAARRELRKQFPEPYFWAPFIYLGNPN